MSESGSLTLRLVCSATMSLAFRASDPLLDHLIEIYAYSKEVRLQLEHLIDQNDSRDDSVLTFDDGNRLRPRNEVHYFDDQMIALARPER